MTTEADFTKRQFFSFLLGGGALLAGLGSAEAAHKHRRRSHKPHPHKGHPHAHRHPHAQAEHGQGGGRSSEANYAESANGSLRSAGGSAAGAGGAGAGAGGAGAGAGGAGAGSGSGGAGGWSDRRLKRDIVQLGVSPSGLPIYAFQYIWGGPRYIGVMAQDLLKLRPEAVILDESGYYRIDYALIDVAMREEPETVAA